jgi:hypothetical protein
VVDLAGLHHRSGRAQARDPLEHPGVLEGRRHGLLDQHVETLLERECRVVEAEVDGRGDCHHVDLGQHLFRLGLG